MLVGGGAGRRYLDGFIFTSGILNWKNQVTIGRKTSKIVFTFQKKIWKNLIFFISNYFLFQLVLYFKNKFKKKLF